MPINHAALNAQSANANANTNTNTMNNTNTSSNNMTKDIRNACGFRIYENVKANQEANFNRDSFLASGRMTNTYHGALFRNRKTEAVFGNFSPLPEAMNDKPGYHAIVELLFPDGQTRTLTQAETIEFWAIVLNVKEDDADLPFFRIKYQLDMDSSEIIDMIQEGELACIVFEFNNLQRAFKAGGTVTVSVPSTAHKDREELIFYPARGYHSVKFQDVVRDSDSQLVGIKFPNASLVDDSIKDLVELPVAKATKSSIRRPGRRAAAAAVVVAPVAPVAAPVAAPVVEPVVEPVVVIDNVPVQTIIATASADVANNSVVEAPAAPVEAPVVAPAPEPVIEAAPAAVVADPEPVVVADPAPVEEATTSSGMSASLMEKFKTAGVKANSVNELSETPKVEETPAEETPAEAAPRSNKGGSSLLARLKSVAAKKVANMTEEEMEDEVTKANYELNSDSYADYNPELNGDLDGELDSDLH